MNRLITTTVAAVALLLCLGAFNDARADETLKFRQFMHVTFAQSQDVGDVEGHAISLYRFSGIASFPDGMVGTVYLVGTNDYTNGAGPNSGYFNLTLKDGSILWYRGTGTAAVDGATTLIEGTICVLGGKGRFEGANGNGTISGARVAPLATGADLYQDIVINVKK